MKNNKNRQKGRKKCLRACRKSKSKIPTGLARAMEEAEALTKDLAEKRKLDPKLLHEPMTI